MASGEKIYIYLILLLIVGWIRIKAIQNIKTFFIIERKYSTAVIVALVTVTLITGGTIIGTIEKIYQYGIAFYLALFGIIISIFVISEFIAPKISNFYDCISLGDIISKAYGKEAKILIGFASVVQCLIMFRIQMIAFGYVLFYFFSIDYKTATFLGYAITVIYSIYGGIKLVTLTDVIQFGMLMIAIPMICNTGLLQVGGYIYLFQALPEESTLVFDLSKSELIKYIGLFITLLIPSCGPYTIQRLLMTQNTDQAVRAFRYSGLVIFIYYFLLMLIALSVLILESDLNPIVSLPYLIENFLPDNARTIAILGLGMIIIASANTMLNSGAISLVHDLIQGFKKNPLNAKTEVILSEISSVVIASLSMAFHMNATNVIDMILAANEIWIPIIFVPFIMAIYKIKINKIGFFISVISGMGTVILWKQGELRSYFNINGTLPGVLVSLAVTTIWYKSRPNKLYGRGREI